MAKNAAQKKAELEAKNAQALSTQIAPPAIETKSVDVEAERTGSTLLKLDLFEGSNGHIAANGAVLEKLTSMEMANLIIEIDERHRWMRDSLAVIVDFATSKGRFGEVKEALLAKGMKPQTIKQLQTASGLLEFRRVNQLTAVPLSTLQNYVAQIRGADGKLLPESATETTAEGKLVKVGEGAAKLIAAMRNGSSDPAMRKLKVDLQASGKLSTRPKNGQQEQPALPAPEPKKATGFLVCGDVIVDLEKGVWFKAKKPSDAKPFTLTAALPSA